MSATGGGTPSPGAWQGYAWAVVGNEPVEIGLGGEKQISVVHALIVLIDERRKSCVGPCPDRVLTGSWPGPPLGQ